PIIAESGCGISGSGFVSNVGPWNKKWGPCDLEMGPQPPDCNEKSPIAFVSEAAGPWVPNCALENRPGEVRYNHVADIVCKANANQAQCEHDQETMKQILDGAAYDDLTSYKVLVGPKYGNDQHVYTV